MRPQGPEPLEPAIGQQYAWLARDPQTLEEGIIAGVLPGIGAAPLVFAHAEHAEHLRGQALDAARSQGLDAHLVLFVRSGRVP
jgi:hypothetical protein